MIAALLAGVLGFAMGYAARILRPVRRVDTWAWDQVYRRSRDLRDGRPRKRPGWYGAQLALAVEVAGLLVVRPRQMIRHWRTRNDPPRKSPPVVIISTTDGP